MRRHVLVAKADIRQKTAYGFGEALEIRAGHYQCTPLV